MSLCYYNIKILEDFNPTQSLNPDLNARLAHTHTHTHTNTHTQDGGFDGGALGCRF